MSNEFIQAADDANRLLNGFAAVRTVADAFAKVGLLQQAQAEAEAALAEAAAAIADARAELCAAKTEGEQVLAETQAVVAQAALRAAGTVNDAAARVTWLKSKGELIASDAEAYAAHVRAEVAEEVAAHSVAMLLATEELDATNAKIAAAKASIADLLK